MTAGEYVEPPTPAIEGRLMYPVDEAARLLGGISRRQLYRLMSSGSLASLRIGSRRLIPRASILDFIAEQQNAQALRPARASMEVADATARSGT